MIERVFAGVILQLMSPRGGLPIRSFASQCATDPANSAARHEQTFDIPGRAEQLFRISSAIFDMAPLPNVSRRRHWEACQGRRSALLAKKLLIRRNSEMPPLMPADVAGRGATAQWPDRNFVPGKMRDYCMFVVPSSAGGSGMVTGAGGR